MDCELAGQGCDGCSGGSFADESRNFRWIEPALGLPTTADFGEQIGGDPIAPCAARARDEGWHYRELATRHDPQVFVPERLVELLEELISAT
jgi:hypothetical protein